jgi:hypothetical protein
VNQQLFLFVNIILVLIFAVLFWIGRRAALKNNPQFKMTADTNSRNKTPTIRVIGENLDDLNADHIKSLNVMFVYNGHTWDAHEVLGIKPGSSMSEIRQAFEKAIHNNDIGTHEFLKTALGAIFQNLKNQGVEPK